jgi:hypothetical protein
MTVRFSESFEGMATGHGTPISDALVQRGWLESIGTSFNTTFTNFIRTGTGCAILAAADHMRWYSGGVEDTFIFCFAWGTENQGAVAYEICQLEYNDGATHNLQLSVFMNFARGIDVYRGTRASGTLIGQTLEPVIVVGAINDIQIKVKISDTVGTLDVKVDNVSKISETGIDTNNGAGNIINQIHFRRDGEAVTAGSRFVDDFYIMDTAGTKHNDFLGVEARVYYFQPDRDITTAWTPLGGGDSYVEVDDLAPDDDTSYVSTATNGARVVVGVTNANEDAITEVFTVEVAGSWRLEQGGADQIKLVNELSSAVQLSAALAGTTQYQTENQLFEDDPNGFDWTPAKVIAMGIGAENQS